jgi:hypothetical protein
VEAAVAYSRSDIDRVKIPNQHSRVPTCIQSWNFLIVNSMRYRYAKPLCLSNIICDMSS